MLEVGVGIGVDAMQWSRAGNRVFGIDYNLPSVQITKARFQDAGAEGRFLNSDAENLPFADNSFDLVYSFGVLHHTPGTEKAIREVYRVPQARRPSHHHAVLQMVGHDLGHDRSWATAFARADFGRPRALRI